MAVSDISGLVVHVHAEERNFTVFAFNHSRPIDMCLLKMGAWRPKHVEDYDTIKCLWKLKCIKLVTLSEWYVFDY
jgi:hypothetical protein